MKHKVAKKLEVRSISDFAHSSANTVQSM